MNSDRQGSVIIKDGSVVITQKGIKFSKLTAKTSPKILVKAKVLTTLDLFLEGDMVIAGHNEFEKMWLEQMTPYLKKITLHDQSPIEFLPGDIMFPISLSTNLKEFEGLQIPTYDEKVPSLFLPSHLLAKLSEKKPCLDIIYNNTSIRIQFNRKFFAAFEKMRELCEAEDSRYLKSSAGPVADEEAPEENNSYLNPFEVRKALLKEKSLEILKQSSDSDSDVSGDESDVSDSGTSDSGRDVISEGEDEKALHSQSRRTQSQTEVLKNIVSQWQSLVDANSGNNAEDEDIGEDSSRLQTSLTTDRKGKVG